MKYALLIYAVPGASENPGPAPAGVIEDWLDYTVVHSSRKARSSATAAGAPTPALSANACPPAPAAPRRCRSA